MPIYEYQCDHQDCGIKIEYLQKMTDEPIMVCPKCNNQSLRRLVSAAGFRLKGGGWYETDFKDNNAKKKNLSSTTITNGDDKAVKTQDTNVNTTSKDAAAKSDNHATTSSDKQTTKE